MLASSRLKPANGWIVAAIARQIIKWCFHMIIEPSGQVSECVEFVIRQLIRPVQIGRSTEQTRSNMRIFINLTAEKPNKHNITMNRSTFSCDRKMAAGEGVEPSFSSSKPGVLPVTPSRIKNLVAAEGIEPTSLDYQSSALSLSYTAT